MAETLATDCCSEIEANVLQRRHILPRRLHRSVIMLNIERIKRNLQKNRPQRNRRMNWLLSLGFLAFCFPSCAAVGPFATNNGYDNEGGTDPICWDSRVYWNETEDSSDHPNAQVRLNENFDVLNNRTYAESNEVTQLDIRKSCFRGTSLEVNPMIKKFDGSLLTGETHSFRLDLRVVPSRVISGGYLAQNSNATAWFRLLLCDAVKTGFCSPFVGMGDTPTVEETDFDDPIIAESSSWDIDKYGYTHNRTLVGVKEGSHIFTRYARWDLMEEEPGSGVFNATVDMQIVLPDEMSGFYFFIGHAIFFVDSPTTDSSYQLRVDVADSVPDNVIQFQQPPDISVISTGFKIGVGIAIGLFLVGELFVFFFIIRHRKHPVMQLAQAPFLAMLMGCVITCTGCSFVFMPTHDIFCNLRGLLVEVPLSMIAAILVGRVWRAYSTLSAALRIGIDKKKESRSERWLMVPLTAIARFPANVLHSKESPGSPSLRRRNSFALRQKVSSMELLRLIIFLVLPQLTIQILGVCLYQRDLIVDLAHGGMNGRQICDTDSRWPTYVGFVIVGCLFLLAVVLAWVARDLPSALNEKSGIFHSSAFNTILAFLVLSLVFIADSPTTSPNVTSFLWIAMLLGIVLSTTVLIVLPKVRRVMSGEKIVISNLLSSPTGRACGRRSSLDAVRASITSSEISRQQHAAEQNHLDQFCETSSAEAEGPLSLDPTVIDLSNVPSSPEKASKAVYLQMNEPPPTRVEGEMFTLKDICANMTAKSLEGHQILLRDWTSLMRSVANLHEDLDRIELMWTPEDEETLFADEKGVGRRT